MRSLRWLLGIVVLGSLAVGAAKAEEPHVDLIRGLRSAGEPELAMEYLQKVAAAKPSPALATLLALETARTRLELALYESEEGKRVSLLAQARSEFEAFLKANANHPLSAQANFEIARLIASQGKEQLTRANRQEDAAQQQKGKDQARALFNEAAKRLQEAENQLQQKWKQLASAESPEEKATARELEQAMLQSQLEQGVNLFLISQTYKVNLERNKAVERAQKVLEKLAGGDEKNAMTWIAKAWLARCEAETQNFPAAKNAFDAIAKEKSPYVEHAQRLASYFRIRMLIDEGQSRAPQIQSDLEGWLNRYRAYHNTPEGFGVKYLLALNLQAQAASGIQIDEKTKKLKSVTATAEALLMRASALYKDLIDVENEFTERATNRRLGCILAIAFRRARDRDVSKLNSFDECYLIALVELAELNQLVQDKNKGEPGTDEVDLDKERKIHHLRVIRALERALALVKPVDNPKDVLDARLMLIFSNLIVGMNHQAAILGEHLARTLTRSGRGATAALYALQAHVNVMSATAKRDAEEDVKEAELLADRRQIRRLAEFMEKTWPHDTPTDFARYQLASLAAREGNFVEALNAYARITPSFVNLAYVRNEQGIACYNLLKDDKVPAAAKNAWFQRVTTELDKMPDLAANAADAESAQAYCLARIQLGHLHLQQKDPKKAQTIAAAVLAQLPKYGILTGTEQQNEVKYAAVALQVYALYTQLYDFVQAGDHVQAAKLYQPFIEELKKSNMHKEEAAERARQAIRSLLQLALRSSVQEGQIARAQDLLKILEEASQGQGSSGPLVAVLRDVQAQITQMRRKEPNRLKDMMDRFTAFLDDLAKQKNLTNDIKIFLAQGYVNLDRPEKATVLLKSIAPPDPAKADEDQKRLYNFVQLSLVRSLRCEARLLLPPREQRNDKAKMAPCLAKVDEAKKLLAEIVGTPQKKGWGFNSLEVRRESIFILEDMEQYQPAMQAWNQMQKPFADKLKQVPANKEEAAIRTAYFEIRHYQYRLVYKSNLKNPNQKTGMERIRGLADQIVKLERDDATKDFGGLSVQRLYEEWIEGDDVIRKAYKEAGGVALLPADERPTTAAGPTSGQ